jgi:hypothetical protein
MRHSGLRAGFPSKLRLPSPSSALSLSFALGPVLPLFSFLRIIPTPPMKSKIFATVIDGIEIDTDPEHGTAMLRVFGCTRGEPFGPYTAERLRYAAKVLTEAAQNIEADEIGDE